MSHSRAPARGRQPYLIEDSSDDESFRTHRRSSPRLTERGARGAATNRGRITAPRGRAATATGASARNGSARSRGTNAAARGGRVGPIVGGRQNQMRQHVNRLIAGNGHAYRVGRPRPGENASNNSSGTIVIEDEDEDEEESDDAESFLATSDDDDDGGPNEYDLEDSFINDQSRLDGHYGFDSDFDDASDNDELDGDEGDGNPEEDTFSQEVEEFELMEERETAASRKAEERLRKKEDKEEKENKNALRTDMFGACTVCAEDEVTDPVGCIYCAGFIGCRKCAQRWYRTSKGNNPEKMASCPLCREKWPSAFPEVGDMLDLVKCA